MSAFDTHHAMATATSTATFQTISPNGDRITLAPTPLHLADACVLWAWSRSCDSWQRQTECITYSDAAAYIRGLVAECPTVRPAITPALLSV